ncbi:MAG: APC family permease [Actinomycetales bacterium]|nr:APC family permease [Actinomycetales bacterium]
MPPLADTIKRLVFGRKLRSETLGETLLPKRIALPIFASDALSSNAYATQEILLVLAAGGAALTHYSVWMAAAVVLVFTIVVLSYRQNVHAYPSGGGDYEVVTVNLGPKPGLVVASALLVDYVLTVAVSVSAAVANVASVFPVVFKHQTGVALGAVTLLTLMNLRGVRESGAAFAIPVYGFIASIFLMLGYALWQVLNGATLEAESKSWQLAPESVHTYSGLALVFLLMRSFSSGTTALTGVEAISNGVPAFRHPKSKNAATTLAMLGVISMAMFSGITWLALKTGVKIAEHDADLIGLPAGESQKTVIAQVANAVFSDFRLGAVIVAGATALILVLAANTAFNGFPVLGSVLARDGYLPRQLHTRGDRLAFSNGIVALAVVAGLLIWIYDAQVSRLIQLYIIGVFVSFTLSQLGMIRHWTRLLRNERDRRARSTMLRSRFTNAVGFVLTGTVLVIVLLTKFTHGAYIVCIAMPIIFAIMAGIRRHYDRVAVELAPSADEEFALPARVHAVVLISKIHKPALRALSFARATRPTTLEALTVAVDSDTTDALMAEWDRRGIPVPLRVLDSPFREITRPIVDHVVNLRRQSPRDLVVVYVPEYIVGRWWEQLLHNHSALRLKARLLFTPGVLLTSVPWQLESSEQAAARVEQQAAGAVRRGAPSSSVAEQVVASQGTSRRAGDGHRD